jgi:hypothetical protein
MIFGLSLSSPIVSITKVENNEFIKLSESLEIANAYLNLL